VSYYVRSAGKTRKELLEKARKFKTEVIGEKRGEGKGEDPFDGGRSKYGH